MDPSTQSCPNLDCPARGQVGPSTITVHSWKERRYRCQSCRRTFAATTGTPLFRLQSPAELVLVVLSLLSYGCPVQAIVVTFGLDERTVAAWLQRAGQHCHQVHQHLVQHGQIDLQHVQADEVWVNLVGQRVWLAMALAAPTRLWLGGVISPQRDRVLITALVQHVRACAASLAILVCVDGQASYVTAFLRVFREPIRTGRRGRPPLVVEPGLLIGQVVTCYRQRRVVSTSRRVVRGTAGAIGAVLQATATGTGIHTADDIERLNATFRSHLAPLVRRGRAIAHTAASLEAGMWLVGCADNLCWSHDSLRLMAPVESGRTWLERTPAMAADLTDHPWTLRDVLLYRVPLPAWVAPEAPRPSRQAAPTTAADGSGCRITVYCCATRSRTPAQQRCGSGSWSGLGGQMTPSSQPAPAAGSAEMPSNVVSPNTLRWRS